MFTKIISITITLFWIIMMATLVKDLIPYEISSGDATYIDPQVLTEELISYSEAMRVIYKDKQVGVMTIRVSHLSKLKKYLVAIRVVMLVGVGEYLENAIITTGVLLDSKFILSQFTMDIEFLNLSFKVKGLVDGEYLNLRLDKGGAPALGVMPLPYPISFLEAAHGVFFRNFRYDLKVGNRYVIPVFDPTWSFQSGQLELYLEDFELFKEGKEEVLCFKVNMRLGKMRNTLWVDSQGNVWKRQLSEDLILKRIEHEERSRLVEELIGSTEIPTLTPADFDIPDAEEIDLSQIQGLLALLKGTSDIR